jgi:23S rRNA pseudouridine1911/1915/1917 synthase
VHRLDRDTSGVLLVAKQVGASRSLGRQFQSRRVEKTYLAVAEGVFPRRQATIRLPLSRVGGGSVRVEPDRRDGKDCVTDVALERRFGHFCLLRVSPRTGRQHQVRVHLAATGYPLAVDGLYGRRERLTGADVNEMVPGASLPAGQLLLERMPLHAHRIRYEHPRTGERMEQTAPIPDDMAQLLELLGRVDPP